MVQMKNISHFYFKNLPHSKWKQAVSKKESKAYAVITKVSLCSHKQFHHCLSFKGKWYTFKGDKSLKIILIPSLIFQKNSIIIQSLTI